MSFAWPMYDGRMMAEDTSSFLHILHNDRLGPHVVVIINCLENHNDLAT